MTRGREYPGCVEEYTVDKNERGNNLFFNMKAVGKISRGERTWKYGEENQYLKDESGEEYWF